jgi:hypothetical protein
MSRTFAMSLGIGAVFIAVVAAFVVYGNRSSFLVPTGRILQVRTAPMTDDSSILLIDFEATNPSGREMRIRYITVAIHTPDGASPDNMAIAGTDLPMLFRAHPELGRLDHPYAHEREVIGPGQTVDQIIAVRYDLSESDLKKRKDLQLVVEDVTGPKLELTAK